jgi:hypothetical protein
MASVHDGIVGREPRPAWIRSEDPLRRSRRNRRREALALGSSVLGLVGTAAVVGLALTHPALAGQPALLALILTSSLAGLSLVGRSVLRVLARTSWYRFRHIPTVRRYALGHVFETALKGKGVVSLERTVKYLQPRAGKWKVSRRAVRKALIRLAREFDAPITRVDGDFFFGFRNVKRQFLASQVQRAQLQLTRKAGGKTVFDSGDSVLVAAQRELEEFDRALAAELPVRAG